MNPFAISGLPEIAGLPMLTFSDGRLLFDESRQCLGFLLVSAGSIRVFKPFANGREILLYRVTPGRCVSQSTPARTGR